MRILCAVPFLTSAVNNGPLDVNGRERHVPAIASKKNGGGTYFSGDEMWRPFVMLQKSGWRPSRSPSAAQYRRKIIVGLQRNEVD
jgi:hypothetical protein